MDIKIEYLDLESIYSIENDWKRLEKGKDMTYFQQFSWYAMLARINKKEQKSKKFFYSIAIVKNDSIIVLIAPLWIVLKSFGKVNKKGAYIFGRGQWSDYLNFIYDDFKEEYILYLLKSLKSNFGIDNIICEQIKISSQLYQFLQSKGSELKLDSYVALTIPDSVKDYQLSLSKNARQNIRTATNRTIKDNLNLQYCFDDKNIDLDEFIKLHDSRTKLKNNWKGKNIKWEICNFISSKILRRGEYRGVRYTPYTHDKLSKFMTVKADDDLCAAFNYGYDLNHRCVLLLAVATNPKYYRYSPGILLLYNFIINEINKNDGEKIKILDFTRGNESYKFTLGGIESKISSLNLKF